MSKLRAVIVGAGRMAGTIDDECIDYPAIILPFSHAAGYSEVDEVDLVAFADLDESKARALAERYGAPRAYADYREMIEKERPDIVSIATPCTAHAEIAIFAAGHGARGIYCEKGLACSLAEADAIREAVRRSGAKFNMGTLRRWHPGMIKAREMIEAGEIGALRSIVNYSAGSLLHSMSHYIDGLLFLAGDPEVEWVQGTVLNADFDPQADRSETDLSGMGTIRFDSGVFAYMLSTSLVAEFEAIGAGGAIRARNNLLHWDLRKTEPIGHRAIAAFNIRQFPYFERSSPTVALIRDLVHAIETDGDTRGGIDIAHLNTEIAFAMIESHRRGGARVTLPLENRDFYMVSR
ncbi:MAG: Gfo/Idh/MocA family oxidoreductase [Armatimonadetes bacterium]|nr:Gfo/Idh/MocA family oxidoreductase [Armatimonadota bacterium]